MCLKNEGNYSPVSTRLKKMLHNEELHSVYDVRPSKTLNFAGETGEKVRVPRPFNK